MRALAVAAALALVVVSPAAADILGTAQVRDSSGKLVAAAHDGTFSYPDGGGLVSIARVRGNGSRARLDDVTMLGGRIHADRITLRKGQAPLIENLVVDGLLRDAAPNSLFSLDTSSYLVVSQKAVIGKSTGVVALRLDLGPGYPGAPGGAQVLVGLRERGAPARAQLASKVVTASGPWAALGFGTAPSLAGLPVVTEPLVGGILPPPPATSVGGKAVAIASQFLGVPYRWGGASPVTGFDCSGLAMYVYAQLGIRLDHYTGLQIHEGTSVPASDLAPGDLVFFDGNVFGTPGHEGIYIGEGMFIQAPHTGDVVRVSSLASYASRYVGAVRPY
jgi:cell wall-associated NlpC family hydrolase